MRAGLDWRLYLVTDRALAGDRPLEQVVKAAVAGGVSIVQVREKDLPTRDLLTVALRVKDALTGSRVPLIINDRVDVALACGADGVHLGQQDLPVSDARRLLGPDAIIGLSVEHMDQVHIANEWDVDYLGVSPIFPTATKTDTVTAWGIEGLKAIRRVSAKPLIAIGGLNRDNAAEMIRAGADSVAVVSAICAAADPATAARALRDAMHHADTD